MNFFTLSAEKKYLFKVLKPYKYVVVLFLFMSVLASIFDGISIGLLIPLLSHLQDNASAETLPKIAQWLINLLLPYSLEQKLIISVGFVVLAVLLKNILLGFAFREGAWLSNRICADMRSQIVKLMLTVRIDFHHRSRKGELLEKTVNYTYFMKDLLAFSIQFVVFSLMLVILLSLMVILSWRLTLFALLIGTGAMVIMSLYLKTLSHYGGRQAKASREFTNAVEENLGGIQLIKTYSKEQRQFLKLTNKIEDYAKSDNRVMCRVFWSQPITEGLGVIVIGILLIGSYVILHPDNKLLLIRLLPFLYILLRVVTALKLLNESRGHIKSRLPYLKFIYDLVREDNKPIIPDGHCTFPGLEREIKFDSVSFSYDNDKIVLRDIDFTIPRGKTTAIVGKSGTGKSTVVNLLLRFYDPQKGDVLIDNQPLKDFQLASYRKKISIVSQETFIFHDTVRYNIAFGMDEQVSDEALLEAAKKAGAHDFIMELPNGYDTILGERGVTLSGGQRQRISIARALLKDPEILILDEATSSLDAVTEKRIHDAILELQRNRTVVIIAHRLSTIKSADQIIVLKDGRVVEKGSPEQLLKNGKEYFNLVQAQENNPHPKNSN